VGPVDQDVVATSVRISSTSHRVRVVAEPRDAVLVEGAATVEQTGSLMTIGAVRGRLVVRVPEGTDLAIGTTSGSVAVDGSVGRTAIISSSGRVDVEGASAVDIRTGSARVTVGRATGECRIRAASGRVEVGACGSADVTTETGRIGLLDVAGPVRAHSVSGRIEVGLTASDDVDAETVSGRISVTVPRDVEIHRHDDQSASTSWPDGTECHVTARSVNGRIDVAAR
jgi:DUF4097 and DUF4098 domain-containing protein YvlB